MMQQQRRFENSDVIARISTACARKQSIIPKTNYLWWIVCDRKKRLQCVIPHAPARAGKKKG
jgi:hypothetical protein